jgi:hypothetical protein
MVSDKQAQIIKAAAVENGQHHDPSPFVAKTLYVPPLLLPAGSAIVSQVRVGVIVKETGHVGSI